MGLKRCRCTAPLRADDTCPYGCSKALTGLPKIKREDAQSARDKKTATKDRGTMMTRAEARQGLARVDPAYREFLSKWSNRN